MTSTALATDRTQAGAIIEQVITKGDLAKLTPEERVQYYNAVCQSIGLNPLTRPFEYLTLQGKTVLYARRDAADQLRKLNNISLSIISQHVDGDLFTAHVRAETRDGRTDEDFGVVNIAGLKGEARANAILKAITKGKRRVTLSIAGLGFMDESEVDDIEPRQAPQPPQSVVAELDSFAEEALRFALERAAMQGIRTLRAAWQPLTPAERALFDADERAEFRRVANEADEAAEAEAQREDDPFGLLPVEPPPFADAPELPRSDLWNDGSYTVPLLSPPAGPQWKEWSDRVGYLASEARTLAELDKLVRDNSDMLSRARRESGDDWRHVQDAAEARRMALGGS